MPNASTNATRARTEAAARVRALRHHYRKPEQARAILLECRALMPAYRGTARWAKLASAAGIARAALLRAGREG